MPELESNITTDWKTRYVATDWKTRYVILTYVFPDAVL